MIRTSETLRCRPTACSTAPKWLRAIPLMPRGFHRRHDGGTQADRGQVANRPKLGFAGQGFRPVRATRRTPALPRSPEPGLGQSPNAGGKQHYVLRSHRLGRSRGCCSQGPKSAVRIYSFHDGDDYSSPRPTTLGAKDHGSVLSKMRRSDQSHPLAQ